MKFLLPASLLVSVAMVFLLLSLLKTPSTPAASLNYEPRVGLDVSGYSTVNSMLAPWANGRDLADIKARFTRIGDNVGEMLDQYIQTPTMPAEQYCGMVMTKATVLQYDGRSDEAYQVLVGLRKHLDKNPALAEKFLYTTIYYQGVIALRRGENDNCIMCRGESSCILPISAAAMHKNQEGSRLAIEHFTEYLKAYPHDIEVRWLLNVAHMTLGEHPAKVDPRYVLKLDNYNTDAYSVGRFRDIGATVGVNRLNQAGGGIMEDFDNDGLLDIVVTSFDPTQVMGYYRNKGDGRF